jgi:hypothetical protein
MPYVIHYLRNGESCGLSAFMFTSVNECIAYWTKMTRENPELEVEILKTRAKVNVRFKNEQLYAR